MILSLLVYLGFDVIAAYQAHKELFTTSATATETFTALNTQWSHLNRTIGCVADGQVQPWDIIDGNFTRRRTVDELEMLESSLKANRAACIGWAKALHVTR